MPGRRWIIGVSALLAGCNLLSGAADLASGESPGSDDDAATPDSPAAPDGSTKPGTFTDGSSDTSAPYDGSRLNGDADADAGLPRPDGGRFVFVTSTTTTGNVQGLAKADQSCTAIAASAGLGGTWIAWLSALSSQASARLTFGGPWYLVDGKRVALTKATLTGFASMLERPIDIDENGVAVANGTAWTGASFVGDCTTWTSAAAGVTGLVGSTSATSPLWSQSAAAACNTQQRLYCFEN